MSNLLLILLVPVPSLVLVLGMHYPSIVGGAVTGAALAYSALAFGREYGRKYDDHKDRISWHSRWMTFIWCSFAMVVTVHVIVALIVV